MELEWQKIKVELAKRIDSFLDQLGNDEAGIDSSVCGYFPEDISLRMAESATNVLQASAAGQRYLREQEIESA